jgi:hypothetical protein
MPTANVRGATLTGNSDRRESPAAADAAAPASV